MPDSTGTATLVPRLKTRYNDEIAAALKDQLGIENLVVTLLGLLGDIGATGAPRFPSVSVVPLALYRVVPGAEART